MLILKMMKREINERQKQRVTASKETRVRSSEVRRVMIQKGTSVESKFLSWYILRSCKEFQRENTEILGGIQTVRHKSEVMYYTKTVSKLQKFSVLSACKIQKL